MQDAHKHNLKARPSGGILPALISSVLVLGSAAGVPAAAPTTQPAAETIVRLHPTAVVTGEQVTFGDIADLTGEAAAVAGSWPIAAAPHLGSAGTIDIRHLERVLSRRGVNLSNWVFRGASRCVVSRPVASVPRQPGGASGSIAQALVDSRTARGPATRPSALTPATAPANGVIPGTLEAAIHEHLRRRLARTGGVLLVRFSPMLSRLLTLSAPNYEFRITSCSDRPLGMVSLEVSILERGQTAQVVQVICDVSVRKQVVVPTRTINAGEMLHEGDLTLAERVFKQMDEIGVSDLAAVIGQRAKRLIHTGEGLTANDVEPVPLVERNDLVTVSVRRNGLAITAAARAMQSGCYGDTIRLRSESSKETYMGTVTGPKKVDLAEPRTEGGMSMGGRR